MMTPTTTSDVAVLRELARRYAEVAAEPIQQTRRDLWRKHNSLQPTRPPIYLRGGTAQEEIPDVASVACEEKFFRGVEKTLRWQLFWASCGDDSIFEPWFVLPAVHEHTGWGVTGEVQFAPDAEPGAGSYKEDYPLKSLDDIDKLVPPQHRINEAATAELRDRLAEALGDLLPVVVDRRPWYFMWHGDLSTDLGHLRGIENFMLDMMDDPEGLHRLMQVMSDGVLRTHDQAEAAGDWTLLDHQNQAMGYAEELPDPASDGKPIARKQLWGYMASQELTLVSPAQHEEFMLRYQLPIVEKFGLSAYGCCEDLTRKIDMLRQIPNLRRIAVSPMANLPACAEQIGTDYVISWRPSPAEMVCTGFDPERIRKATREALDVCHGLHMDITLKDVQTVQNDPRRLAEWVRITRETIEG